MPHQPGHLETPQERQKRINQQFALASGGRALDPVTGEVISQKEFQSRESSRELSKKHLGRAEDIIGQQRTGLLEAQKTQFEQSRRAFQERLNLALGAQVGQARRGFVQSAARRGLTGSGVEQAGIQAVRAAGQQQFAQSLGEFETKLSLAQESERAQFRGRSFDFLAAIAKMAAQTDFEKELLRFQAQIAADAQRSQMFGDILSKSVQVIAPFLKDDNEGTDLSLLTGGQS